MPRFSKTRAIGSMGEHQVAKICAAAGAVFSKIDGTDDVGIDGHVEFSEQEFATGHWIKVQVKSGGSFRNADGSYCFESDLSHYRLWSKGILPVAGVVYDPEFDRCFWVDVSAHLRSDASPLRGGLEFRRRRCSTPRPSMAPSERP